MSIQSDYYSFLNQEDYLMLKQYLKQIPEKKENRLNVVIDLLHNCDLNCVGCGTNAVRIPVGKSKHMASLGDLKIIAEKIKEYADNKRKKVFINLGGGEPFMHPNIEEIIYLFCSYFGTDGVGIDTNGTLDDSVKLIKNVSDNLSYLGISLNGLRTYHNWWAGIEPEDAYGKTWNTIEMMCNNPKERQILEVTSVATRKNMSQLPELMYKLSMIGVQKYSVHRAIPVGRMVNHIDLLPDSDEYTKMLVELIKVQKKTGIAFHMHHSIDNIHKALLLEENTYNLRKLGDKNTSSSIGVTPDGDVVFNAWCTSGSWKNLTCGNLLDDGSNLQSMLENQNSLFYKACLASSLKYRCYGCGCTCSGGSRIVAAAVELQKSGMGKYCSATAEDLLEAFVAVDPACPRYKEIKNRRDF